MELVWIFVFGFLLAAMWGDDWTDGRAAPREHRRVAPSRPIKSDDDAPVPSPLY